VKVWRVNLSGACRTCAKTADLAVADRIKVNVVATPGLKEAIEANRDYITAETLTVELRYAGPDPDPPAHRTSSMARWSRLAL